MHEKKANRFLALVVGVITAIALVVVTVANKPVKQIDRGKPEGVVQEYLTDVIAGDFDAAIKLLDPAASCTIADLDASYFDRDVRISLVKTTENANGAGVKISVEIPNGGPISGYYSEDHVIRLIKTASGWRITGIPWPMYSCGMATQ
jgi:hypothetical protein